MPDINSFRKVVTVPLPSMPEAVVEMFTSLLYGDFAEIDKVESDVAKNTAILLKVIRSWNLEEDGKALEINEENLKRIPLVDIEELVKQIASTNEEAQKKIQE